MSYPTSISIAAGTGQTSLTLLATLMDTVGVLDATIKDVATGFTEVGAGNYQWFHATIPDSFRGLVVFHVGAVGGGSDFTGVTVKAIADINAEESQNPWALTPRTLTQSTVQVISVLTGSTLTVMRGDNLSMSFTGLGQITGFKDVWLSSKKNLNEIDSAAQLRVSSLNGLQIVNGVAAAASTDGVVTIDDHLVGDVTITVKPAASTLLQIVQNGVYDIQWKTGSDEIFTLTSGTWKVSGDVTRLIS